jgi:hypothetical protein
MTINSSTDICNLALGALGNYGTVSSIVTPTNDKERTFALWYDICRRFTLKLQMPNFALARENVPLLTTTPNFGYGYSYALPTNCLKVLGIDEVKYKRNNYSVEGNQIQSDAQYTTGMPVRYIKDITDVNQFSPEYILLLADYLAAHTCLPITQDAGKAQALMQALPAKINIASGLNAQENMPIRINHSRYKDARYVGVPIETDKK